MGYPTNPQRIPNDLADQLQSVRTLAYSMEMKSDGQQSGYNGP